MDSTLKLVQMARAREDQIAALESSSASKSDMDELRSIRNNGLYRDSYDVEEAKKIAEILGKLFPEGYKPEVQEDELLSVEGIGEETAADLRRRGIETKDDLRDASDEDLLEVPGIGKGRLKEIRASL